MLSAKAPLLIPLGAASTAEAADICSDIACQLKLVAAEKYDTEVIRVGTDGCSFASDLIEETEALELLLEAIEHSGHAGKILLGLQRHDLLPDNCCEGVSGGSSCGDRELVNSSYQILEAEDKHCCDEDSEECHSGDTWFSNSPVLVGGHDQDDDAVSLQSQMSRLFDEVSVCVSALDRGGGDVFEFDFYVWMPGCDDVYTAEEVAGLFPRDFSKDANQQYQRNDFYVPWSRYNNLIVALRGVIFTTKLNTVFGDPACIAKVLRMEADLDSLLISIEQLVINLQQLSARFKRPSLTALNYAQSRSGKSILTPDYVCGVTSSREPSSWKLGSMSMSTVDSLGDRRLGSMESPSLSSRSVDLQVWKATTCQTAPTPSYAPTKKEFQASAQTEGKLRWNEPSYRPTCMDVEKTGELFITGSKSDRSKVQADEVFVAGTKSNQSSMFRADGVYIGGSKPDRRRMRTDEVFVAGSKPDQSEVRASTLYIAGTKPNRGSTKTSDISIAGYVPNTRKSRVDSLYIAGSRPVRTRVRSTSIQHLARSADSGVQTEESAHGSWGICERRFCDTRRPSALLSRNVSEEKSRSPPRPTTQHRVPSPPPPPRPPPQPYSPPPPPPSPPSPPPPPKSGFWSGVSRTMNLLAGALDPVSTILGMPKLGIVAKLMDIGGGLIDKSLK